MAVPGGNKQALPTGDALPPSPPTDRAADAFFDPVAMADAQAMLHKENGAITTAMVLVNLAEYQVRNGANGYRWDGEAWYGGDIDRLVLKSEGEGDFGGQAADAEVQALWGRTISPFFNLQAGVRHDFAPTPTRTYAVFAVEGFAPYWFGIEASAFVSDKGEFSARFTGDYDQRITQRWILQPRIEVNVSAQDVPERGIGAGFTDIELGLRLRYEIRREFAPYVGISWTSTLGNTADFARAAGEQVAATNFVLGIRTWF